MEIFSVRVERYGACSPGRVRNFLDKWAYHDPQAKQCRPIRWGRRCHIEMASKRIIFSMSYRQNGAQGVARRSPPTHFYAGIAEITTHIRYSWARGRRDNLSGTIRGSAPLYRSGSLKGPARKSPCWPECGQISVQIWYIRRARAGLSTYWRFCFHWEARISCVHICALTCAQAMRIAIVTSLLAGCASEPLSSLASAIQGGAVADNNALADATDQILLINILRARDRAPLDMGDLTSVNDALSLSGTVGFSIPFGSKPSTSLPFPGRRLPYSSNSATFPATGSFCFRTAATPEDILC